MAVQGLDEVGAEHLESAGGKGANLGELIRQGFPVPPGFVVGADEYARFIDTLNLPSNDDIPEDTEAFLEWVDNCWTRPFQKTFYPASTNI